MGLMLSAHGIVVRLWGNGVCQVEDIVPGTERYSLISSSSNSKTSIGSDSNNHFGPYYTDILSNQNKLYVFFRPY